MAKKKTGSKLSPREGSHQKLVKRVLKVAERKGKVLGLSGEEYVYAVVMGKYPTISSREVEEERDEG